jgi:hypothetical protein
MHQCTSSAISEEEEEKKQQQRETHRRRVTNTCTRVDIEIIDKKKREKTKE